MNILVQMGLVLGFAYGGHFLSTFPAFPLPASVAGLLLLLAALRLRILPGEWIADAGRFLGANMAFFFLPSAVEIVENYGLFRDVLWELVLICVVTTCLTFGATYFSARLLRRLASGRKGG